LKAIAVMNCGNWKYRPSHNVKLADISHRSFASDH